MLLFSRHLLLLEDIKQKIEKANNEGQTDGRGQQKIRCMHLSERDKEESVCLCVCQKEKEREPERKNCVTLKVKGPFCYSFHVGSGLGKFCMCMLGCLEDVCVSVCVCVYVCMCV